MPLLPLNNSVDVSLPTMSSRHAHHALAKQSVFHPGTFKQHHNFSYPLEHQFIMHVY
eukprot:m.72221 g.72221  ORF g.72221 m.72221 type:complete len:57 (+) comp8769_c0_seq1:1915-2085(+)